MGGFGHYMSQAKPHIPVRPASRSWGTRGSGLRLLLFTLECGLGMVSVILVAALAQWSASLSPVVVLLYLLIVVLIALLCGFWQSVIVSLLAVAIQSYFGTRQPRFDAANSVTVVAFILIALVVSRLSSRVTEHARNAQSWGEQMHELYEFTRRSLQMDLHAEPGPQLAELAHEIFSLEGVIVFDADLHRIYQAGEWDLSTQEVARNAYYFETCDDDLETGISRRVLRLGTVSIGSLVIRGDTTALTNNAIASLIAISFDRYRAFANESHIEAERRTEQLRATVLDSLAHAYKTPLTVIRAASTGLAEMGRLSAPQAELVALIDEQTGALSDLTTRLLTTARLDAGEITIHATSVDLVALLEEVLANFKERLATMDVSVQLPNEDVVLHCDRQLMTMLLTQYLDNACKYSLFGSTITIAVSHDHAETIFSVHGYGPVIPRAGLERIFDRYFRSSTSSNGAVGTGIGLAIAKRAAHLHGGHVWVTSEASLGTTFFASIPTQKKPRCSA
jgi:two-component system sensor histidine kinase KdpD